MPASIWSPAVAVLALLFPAFAVTQEPAGAVSGLPVGPYVAADGSVLSLFQAPLGPAFLNHATGRVGVLHAIGPDRFGAGPGALGKEPIEVSIEIRRGPAGEVLHARYVDSTGRARVYLPRPLPRTLDAAIRHGDVTLAATLSLPEGRGPFPAVLMNHGGGPGVRADLRVWSWFLTHLGYAVLTYDKRGSGATTGPGWETFEDLAGDAAAALRWLKRQAAIDSMRTGVWAYSQSGWVVPLALRLEPARFVVAVSIPVISPADREAASARVRLPADGFSPAETDSALAFLELARAFVREEMTWTAYQRDLDATRQARWFGRLELPTRERAPHSAYYRSEYGYFLDPAPFWSRVDVPVLALYGELDTTVPPAANARVLAAALALNPAAIVTVLPGANHQMLLARTGGDDELVDLNRYAGGYFALLAAFLQAIATRG